MRSAAPIPTVPRPRRGDRAVVVGAGLLGCASALLLAEAGFEVCVIERHADVLSGASAAGEGKVHLGPVYALGDAVTHDVMMRGARAFAPTMERVVGRALDWDVLTSDAFDYVVMPGSLADADTLASAYRSMNEAFRGMGGSDTAYLGDRITCVIDTRPTVHPETGLQMFRSHERAVDMTRLAPLVADALRSHPGITLMTSTEVADIDAESGRVGLAPAGRGACREECHADIVVNCAWEERSALETADRLPLQSIRVKAAAVLTPTGPRRPVTLVQGPFGDVVRFASHTYISWYPVARVHHEHRESPSAAARALCAAAAADKGLAREQLRALAEIGLVDGHADVTGSTAGFVLGQGDRDIDDPLAALHRRDEFGARLRGVMMTPLNFKLTTAPLAACGVLEASRRMCAVAAG